jgi:hypothetical protein
MNKQELTISQSLLKALTKYAEKKECGLKIEALYIDKVKGTTTPAQALGNWFEYKCTGALPAYHPEVPEPKVLKSGKLSVAYERMLNQVENYKQAIKHYKVTDIKEGVSFNWGNITGTADIIAKVDGKPSIIDIKTTALFDNKWEEFGWNTEHLAGEFRPKLNLLLQALHYKWLYKNIYGEDADFYFWVFSTTNQNDFKIIKVNIEDELYEEHANDIRAALNFLMHNIKTGFRAIPEISRCAKCFLSESCTSKIEVPVVSEVWFSTNIKHITKNIGD